MQPGFNVNRKIYVGSSHCIWTNHANLTVTASTSQQEQQQQQGGFRFDPNAAPFTGQGPGGFTFGQPPQVEVSPGNFTFGQQQPQQFSSPSRPSGGFLFGQPSPQIPPQGIGSLSGQSRQGPASFSFGQSAPQSAEPKRFTFGSAQKKPGRDEDEKIDYEAAKVAALSSMPLFAGGGASMSPSIAKPPPPPLAPRSTPAGRGRGGVGLHHEELSKRSQRANRFSIAPSETHTPFGEAGDEDDDEAPAHRPGSGAIVGTCEDMCPAPERERRQSMSDVQIFERVDPGNANLTAPHLAVKRFARTVDDPHPSEFRTRGALQRTMEHLRSLLDTSDIRFGLVHKFLWDRYRSVRQDLYIQGIADDFAVAIFEEIVRFHVLCEHELAGEDQNVTEVEGFNSHLNMEQANKALISLSDMYDTLATAGSPQESEPEFRAYHLISLMSQHGKFKGDQQAFLSTLHSLRPEVKASPAIRWVLSLQRALADNNFVEYFNLVRSAPYLLACAAHTYSLTVRKKALYILADAMCPLSSKPAMIELSWLIHVLMLDSEEDAYQLLGLFGYDVGTDESGVSVAVLMKNGFVEPPPPVPRSPSALITAKAPVSRALAVTTPALQPLSAEELGQLQAQQKRLREEAEAKRSAAAAAAAQKAAEKTMMEARAKQLAEEEQREAAALAERERQRLHMEKILREKALEEEMMRVRAAEEEARRHAAEVRRKEVEEARKREEARLRVVEEARRAAEEAERLRIEAEEAEKRRLAEVERQRLEELRLMEEIKRKRRERKQNFAISKLYFHKWRAETKVIAAERAHQAKIAASFKACRVGILTRPAAETEDELASSEGKTVEQDLHSLSLGPLSEEETAFAISQRAPMHVPTEISRSLLRTSLGARHYFWKAVVLKDLSAALGLSEQPPAHYVGTWLQNVLSDGKIVASADGIGHVQGPLHVVERGVRVEIRTCISMPLSRRTISGALGGAAALITAAGAFDRSSSVLKTLKRFLKNVCVKKIPLLIVVQSHAWAAEWGQALQEHHMDDDVHVISVEFKKSVLNQSVLLQGLNWLSERAPEQPMLRVARTSVVAQECLDAACVPLRSLAVGTASTYLYEAALARVIHAVTEIVKQAHSSGVAQWRWPPSELAEGPLRDWYRGETCSKILLALNTLEGSGSVVNELMLHMKLATLDSPDIPAIVLPEDTFEFHDAQLDQLATTPIVIPANQLLLSNQHEYAESPKKRKRDAFSVSENIEQNILDVSHAMMATGDRSHERTMWQPPVGGCGYSRGLAEISARLETEQRMEQAFNEKVMTSAVREVGVRQPMAFPVLNLPEFEEEEPPEKKRRGFSGMLANLQRLFTKEQDSSNKLAKDAWKALSIQ